MELVYLWVEEYKNIKGQGFNFSPKFECKYDKDLNKLTIDENKKYFNIFSENINVTAIVGENGSGKSTILKFIAQYLSLLLTKIDLIALSPDTFIFIFFDKLSNNIYTTGNVLEDAHIINKTEYKTFSDKIETFKSKKYIDFLKSKKHDKMISLDTNERYNNSIHKHLLRKNLNKLINNSFTLHYDYSFNMFTNYHSETNFLSVPNKEYDIYQHHNYDKTLLVEHIINKSYIEKGKKYFEPNKLLIQPLKNLMSKFQFKLDISIKEFMVFLINSSIFELLKRQHRNFINNKNAENNPKLLDDLIINNIKSIKEIIDNQTKQVPLAYQLKDLVNYLKILKETNSLNIFSIDKEYERINININYLNDNNIKLLTQIPTDILKLKIYSDNFDYDDLSNGEKSALRIRFYIERAIQNSKRDNYFILLDEADNELHPQWQKKLIKYLYDIFKNRRETFHFILTSHSPFILSDLPKENIIFLENGKQEYPFKDNQQTFGANIHTLLSHGFFMEDGLMGEYAKEKINEVIEILKKDTLSSNEIKTCKDIISIIGEPILQKTLQSQLDMKLYPKETQLEKLEREQREIQAKIDEIKKKNETD
ncbi:AAA family ATPase [Malaciobacter sp. WC5094]